MSPATPVEIPLAAVLAAVGRTPDADVFRHRRRGAWVCWTLGDVGTRVQSLAAGFQAARPDPRLVAVVGDYAPHLLVVALAAAQLGAQVVTLPPDIPRAALAQWLGDARPDLAFVGLRSQVGLWRAALQQAGVPTTVVADVHLPWGRPRHGGVVSVTELLGPPPARRAGARRDTLVWVEEGTEWPGGLAYILRSAANAERVLGFPESRAAAARDRRAAQPTGFVLSTAHYRQVQADLTARLPVGDGPTARVLRTALATERPGLFSRWLLHHLRGALGLARLREVTVVGADGPALGEPTLFAALGIASDHHTPDVTNTAGLVYA